MLLALAALRVALAGIAVPLAPFLYREHLHLLVLLRPSKEVLLFAGYRLEEDDINLLVAVPAALPLLVGGVWVMFALGRSYAGSIGDHRRSGLAARLLPPARLEHLVRAIDEQGAKLVFLGRLAAFPSTLVAAAAGAAGMPVRRFLVADAAGALLSLAILLTAGLLLEDAYEDAGPWITAAGVLVLAVAATLLGRSLSRAGRGP